MKRLPLAHQMNRCASCEHSVGLHCLSNEVYCTAGSVIRIYPENHYCGIVKMIDGKRVKQWLRRS